MDLEAELELLRADVADPKGGVFGPDSKLWEVNRHAIIFLGAGRAALLQLAHPWVAQAIADHSRTRDDPIGRFRRTFLRVFAMVYGDLDEATDAARRVHRLHETITGTLPEAAGRFAVGSAYRANEPGALLWVHATLWETSVHVFERVVRALSSEEKEAYYDETRRFAALFSIPERVLPADWTAFLDYNRAMWESDTLAVSAPAREMARFLFRPLHPALGPLTAQYERITAALLPPPVREAYGFESSEADRVLLARWLGFARSERHWPRRLRYLPHYVAAKRRVAGRRSPDPIGDWLQAALVGRSRKR